MKRLLLILLLPGCMTIGKSANGQSQRPNNHNHLSGKQHTVSLGVHIPLGNFSSTHSIGIAANYSWSNHRFGGMNIKPVKPFGFMADGGIANYFGKKEMVSGYPYDYPGYIFVHAYGGAIYNPWRKAYISLIAGPALGIYNGNTAFNVGVNLAGSYYFKEKIGINPGIIFMKESGADPLWTALLKATMAF